MKNQKSLRRRPVGAAAGVGRTRSRSIALGGAAVLASAWTASAGNLEAGNLTALNEFTAIEYGASAAQVYGNLQTIFDTPIDQITSMTPTALANMLNAGLASGAGINFGPGINGLAGAQTITVAEASGIQSTYNADHNNIPRLIADIYGDMQVNLAQVFRSILLTPIKPATPATPTAPIATHKPTAPATPTSLQPNSSTLVTTFNILHDLVMDQVKTVDEEQAATQTGEKSKILGLQPMIAASGFFEQSGLKRGGNLELYGLNLSAEGSSDRFDTWFTVPLEGTTFASSTYMTYGADVGAKYELIQDSGLYVGAHANYLATSGTGSYEDDDWAGGPFLGYTYKINNRFSISTGLLTDYVNPQSGPDTWISAAGVNLGVRLGQHVALNTYYSYWRDLGNDHVILSTDWHEVGVDLTYTLGRSWRLVVGAKTTLGYESYDYDYQIHAGAGTQF